MKIFFGLNFDDRVFPQAKRTEGGVLYVGTEKLLLFFESQLGLVHPSRDNEHLRIEQYRQALLTALENDSNVFFSASFEAGPFATTMELLQRRDDLLLAGWDFVYTEGMPERLQVIAAIEQILAESEVQFPLAYADRFAEVLRNLPNRTLQIQQFFHHEPLELLPFYLQELFKLLAAKGIKIQQISPAGIKDKPSEKAQLSLFDQSSTAEKESNLHIFKESLLHPSKGGITLQKDDSLLIIKGNTESELASWLAQFLRLNPDFRPLCLIPDRSGVLDNAFIQEGLPSLGIQSASLARPSLQVLKLVSSFLWQPIDPFKILEFVSLGMKPVDDDLARRIAEQIAEKPGLHSESWSKMIARFFTELEEKENEEIKNIRKEYHFWFNRPRYDASKTVPKAEAVEIYAYLQKWAMQIFDDKGGNNASLLTLAEQARRICELLEASPEESLTYLGLERVVRAIYQPAPVQVQKEQLGRLDYVQKPGAIAEDAKDLLWWNFIQNEQEHFFSPWYKKELQFLENKTVFLQSAHDKNALQLWQRKQAVLRTQNQLILLIPKTYEGTEVHPHPLLGNLEACFDDIEKITIDIKKGFKTDILTNTFKVPGQVNLESRHIGQPKGFLNLKSNKLAEERENETITGLDALFYYPYKWAFQYKAKLRKSPILSVVSDNRLMGNLSHRFFEILLEKDLKDLDKKAVEKIVDDEIMALLAKEGAVLLLYGREPERLAFINKLKFAAWSLVNLIKSNDWEVVQTEKPLEGNFADTQIKGRADLVLKRDNQFAIIDLKWRGSSYRERELRNEEDLQLILYSKLLPKKEKWAHTAYFIIENGKIIARNNTAFKEVNALSDSSFEEVNDRILKRMRATYQWRMSQLKTGILEIRCQQTIPELEDTYGEEMLDLLEMKNKDAAFDDYRVLIGLVD